MLVYRGNLDDMRRTKWEGKERTTLQFIEKRVGDGGLNLVEISIPDDVNATQWEVGKHVEIPVEVYVGRDQKPKLRYATAPAGMVNKPGK